MFRASRLLPRLAPRAALGAPISQTLLRLQAPRLLPAAQGIRFASKSSDDPPPPKWPIDREHEKKVAQQKLKSDPSKVSEESSAGSRFDFSPTATAPTVPSGSPKDNPEISSGLKHDIVSKQSSTITGLANSLRKSSKTRSDCPACLANLTFSDSLALSHISVLRSPPCSSPGI